jgi:hypothetical protein
MVGQRHGLLLRYLMSWYHDFLSPLGRPLLRDPCPLLGRQIPGAGSPARQAPASRMAASR